MRKVPARMFPSYSYPLISDGQGVVGLTRGQMDLAPEHPVPSGAVTTKPFIEQVLSRYPFIEQVPSPLQSRYPALNRVGIIPFYRADTTKQVYPVLHRADTKP